MIRCFPALAIALVGLATYVETQGSSTSPRLTLAGVNLAGADFGENNLPGTFDVHYTYPNANEVDYFIGKGMNVFRVPFRWERLQRSLQSAFDQTELGRLDSIVSYITSQGAYAVLDPHNYARYHGAVIDAPGSSVTSADFNDFWTRLANLYSDDQKVIFGLMNEPHSLLPSNQGTTELWLSVANSAIGAIRTTGAQNMILVPGNAWTGAHSWLQNWYGTPNGEVLTGVVDPIDNFAFDMHQYFDGDYSGQSETCVSANIGPTVLQSATNWLRQNGYKALLGEIGVGRNALCYTALDNALDFMTSNNDVWLGFTWWAAGPWWGEYIFTLEPTNNFQTDRPQMAVIESYLPAAGLGETGGTTQTATTVATTTTSAQTTTTTQATATTTTQSPQTTTTTTQSPQTTTTTTQNPQSTTTTTQNPQTTTTTTQRPGETSGTSSGQTGETTTTTNGAITTTGTPGGTEPQQALESAAGALAVSYAVTVLALVSSTTLAFA